MTYEIERASLNDSESCVELLVASANWVNGKGTLLWNPDWFSQDYLDSPILNGEVYCLKLKTKIIGMMIIQNSDKIIWPHLISSKNAYYLHKLCVSRKHSGQGLSGLMLDWAISKTKSDNKEFIRLDCARRKKLLEIYKNKGFKKVSNFNMSRSGLPMYYGIRMEMEIKR